MKIIKPGNPQKERMFLTTCANCDCVFQFCAKEVTSSFVINDTLACIRCPTCGSSIDVTNLVLTNEISTPKSYWLRND